MSAGFPVKTEMLSDRIFQRMMCIVLLSVFQWAMTIILIS